MDELNYIGELFRNKLKDHTIEPSDKVWANIQKNIGSSPVTSPKPSLAKYFISGAAIVSVIVATVAVVYFMSPNNKSVNINETKDTQIKEIPNTQPSLAKNDQTQASTQPTVSVNNYQPEKPASTIPAISSQPKTVNVAETISSPFITNVTTPISYVEKTQQTKVATTKENPVEPDNTTIFETIDNPKTNINLDITNDTTVCVGSMFTLKAKGGTAIMWSNGSLFEEAVFTAPNEEGVYTYRAMVQTTNGDTNVSIRVTVKECRIYEQPNAFTPNGDGKNDKFKTKVPDNCTDYSLMIFNRSGMKVFESKDKDLGWDGKFNNEEQKEGAYFYILQYREKSGVLKTVRGSVVIVLR